MPRVSDQTAWEAVETRDSALDGVFVFAVRTTGVYCRPSCPARRPRRENVSFFESPVRAREAGFRACKRCRPDQPARDPVAEASALLVAAADLVPLDQLALRVGLSPSHLQRRFKARFGISPRGFQAARRAERLRTALRASGSVSRATYDAGYGSPSRVYETAADRLGMTPARFASGGAGLIVRYRTADSPFGRLLVAATDEGICAVSLGSSDQALIADLERDFFAARLERDDRGGDRSLGQLAGRVAATMAGADDDSIPLVIRGTAFQQRVWQALRGIPRGTTRSYRDLARAVGRPTAVRAVASAVAGNRLAVLVPCHRVIHANGDLGGYRWGPAIKRRLLEAESKDAR